MKSFFKFLLVFVVLFSSILSAATPPPAVEDMNLRFTRLYLSLVNNPKNYNEDILRFLLGTKNNDGLIPQILDGINNPEDKGKITLIFTQDLRNYYNNGLTKLVSENGVDDTYVRSSDYLGKNVVASYFTCWNELQKGLLLAEIKQILNDINPARSESSLYASNTLRKLALRTIAYFNEEIMKNEENKNTYKKAMILLEETTYLLKGQGAQYEKRPMLVAAIYADGKDYNYYRKLQTPEIVNKLVNKIKTGGSFLPTEEMASLLGDRNTDNITILGDALVPYIDMIDNPKSRDKYIDRLKIIFESLETIFSTISEKDPQTVQDNKGIWEERFLNAKHNFLQAVQSNTEKTKTELEYYEEGNNPKVKKEIRKDGQGRIKKIFEYNNAGQIIKKSVTSYSEYGDSRVSVTEYYDKGTLDKGSLKEQYSYNKNGNLDGSYKRYHANGVVHTNGSYNDGKEDGFTCYFDAKGRLTITTSHKDGKAVFIATHYSNTIAVKSILKYDDEGNKISREDYYPNSDPTAPLGRPKLKEDYQKGSFVEYDERGLILHDSEDTNFLPQLDAFKAECKKINRQYMIREGKRELLNFAKDSDVELQDNLKNEDIIKAAVDRLKVLENGGEFSFAELKMATKVMSSWSVMAFVSSVQVNRFTTVGLVKSDIVKYFDVEEVSRKVTELEKGDKTDTRGYAFLEAVLREQVAKGTYEEKCSRKMK